MTLKCSGARREAFDHRGILTGERLIQPGGRATSLPPGLLRAPGEGGVRMFAFDSFLFPIEVSIQGR